MVAQEPCRVPCARPVAASALCFVEVARTDATDFLEQAARCTVAGGTLVTLPWHNLDLRSDAPNQRLGGR
jgi:hypothetical protein